MNPSAYVKIGTRGELVCRCLGCGAGWREFVEFVGLPPSAWFLSGVDARPVSGVTRVKSRPVAEYPYHDHRGELAAVKVRWEPAFDGRRPKDFTWRRPIPAADRQRVGIPAEAFAWAKGLSAGWYEPTIGKDGTYYYDLIGPQAPKTPRGVELPATAVGPYREHLVEKADPGRPVFVVEGEGKADLLDSLGCVATSGPAGKGVWKPEWGQMLRGRRVYAVPDPDGVDWGCRVLASGVGWGAESLCLVSLPQHCHQNGLDVKDWLLSLKLDREGQRKALWELCLQSKPNHYSRG